MLLFTTMVSFSQKQYSPGTESTQLSLEGKSVKGYKTNFDFGWEEVRRGWWEYARKFGSPLNMKTYYKVTVPSGTTDGNVDMEIFTQTTDGKGGSDFFLGLENEKYKDQALAMLLDFKKNFYIQDLLEQIDEKQKEADDLSTKYRDAVSESEREETLKNIRQLEKDVEGFKEEIKKIEKA